MDRRAALVRARRVVGERAGFTVLRFPTYVELRGRAAQGRRYAHAISEIEALWRDRDFDDLPDRPGRLELLCDLQGTQPSEAMHLLGWLHRALEVPGAVCELGCAHGATTALMANELLASDRHLWVFDSFAGLSAPTAEDELIDDIFAQGTMASYEGTMAYPEAEVRRRLVAVGWPDERLHVVAGYVGGPDDTLQRPGLPEQVAFAYVDMDLYAPIARALEWLTPRVSPGGIVMVDDYGWFSAGAARAVDEHLAAHPGAFELLRPPAFAGHFVGLRRLG